MPRTITDKQRLDWLEKQGDGSNWVARQSTTGRGYRLHNTTRMDYEGHPTVRQAIDAAMQKHRRHIAGTQRRRDENDPIATDAQSRRSLH